MRAVQLTAERKLRLSDLPSPRPGLGEVIVASEYCGICGTDLHADVIDMFLPPVVIGHEFAGTIVELGDGVDGWEVGDKVTVNPMGVTCGVCAPCLRGRPNYCLDGVYRNSIGVARNGGMAEQVAVPARVLFRLPAGMGTLQGAWVEPLAVAVRAVRKSDFRIGDRVCVIGAGPVGLLVAQLLRSGGAAEIAVVEPSVARRATALQQGADHAVPPETAAELGIDRFDGVFECSGHPRALQTALELLARGGYVQLLGAATGDVSFAAILALHKEVRLTSSFIYVDEYPAAIALLASGAIEVEALTSAVVPLERFAEAFEAMREPESTIKALIHV